MKSRSAILFCFVLALFISSCEDELGHTATMRFVIEITDNGDGTCTYQFAKKADDNAADRSMTTDCGRWKVGEGIWLEQ